MVWRSNSRPSQPASRPSRPSQPARAALALVLTLGCSREQVEVEAREAGDKAKQAGEDLAEQAGDKTRALANDASGKAKRWWADEVPDSGELSDKALALVREGADAGGVESFVTRGVQLAPVAVEVAKTLHSVVDGDTVIEPVVQKVDDDAAKAELDAKIADMPRVEAIEGVSVGFKDMKQYDVGGRTSESAYLVLWRREDHLLGFVYRSHHRVDVDTLVRQTPRLIGLVQGAL